MGFFLGPNGSEVIVLQMVGLFLVMKLPHKVSVTNVAPDPSKPGMIKETTLLLTFK